MKHFKMNVNKIKIKTGCFLALELTTDLVSIWVLAKGTTHTDQTLVCSPGNADQVEPPLVI